MTLVANVKGYINGDEWGVGQTITLLSKAELLTLGGGNELAMLKDSSKYNLVLEELNKYPTEYYDQFKDILYRGHNIATDLFYAHEAGTSGEIGYNIYRKTNSSEWSYYVENRGGPE